MPKPFNVLHMPFKIVCRAVAADDFFSSLSEADRRRNPPVCHPCNAFFVIPKLLFEAVL